MSDNTFDFTEERFNSLFPFYLLINEALVIQSFGKSLNKMIPEVTVHHNLADYFIIRKPHTEEPELRNILRHIGKPILLEGKKTDIILRGQFERNGNNLLFLGSPPPYSIETVKRVNLSANDFAAHDSMFDLLEAVNSHEENTNSLKELLLEKKREISIQDMPQIKVSDSKRSTNKEGIVFLHPNGKVFWCNDAYLELTGFTRNELLHNSPEDNRRKSTLDPEDIKKIVSFFDKREAFDIVIKRRKKNGETFWSRTKGQPIFKEDGILTQYITTVEDLTEEKEREEQLSLLSLIAENNINPVVVCNNKGEIEWVSQSFTQMSGYSTEELLGKRPGPLLEGPETDPQTSLYIFNNIKKGLPYTAEVLNYNKDGRKYWVRIHGQALFNQDGEILKYYTIGEDITNKKLLETQREDLLKRLEKSNSELEDYAQIVSHDLKSPLHSIYSLLSWIKDENDGAFNENTKQYFSMIEDKLEKMDNLIQGVLTYSKVDKKDITKESVDINDVIENITGMILIPDNIKIVINNTLPILKADRFRMQQLFQNLIANAITSNDKEKGLIEIQSQEFDDHYLFIVKDNGIGIAKEHLKKIFKKFSSFTSSEKSSGLGLSIVQKIIDNYKGIIWAESEPGVGSAFYIKLPK